MPSPQYTRCIRREAYLPTGWSFAISGLAGLCRYLLGGKLICLGNPAKDERVVGRIAGLEPVGYGKSGFKAIDNDYCINLLLAPLLEDTIHYTSAWGGDAKLEGGPQGYLLVQHGATAGMDFGRYHQSGYSGWDFEVLHCEFEGSRIRDVCAVISATTPAWVGALCKIPLLSFVCALVSVVVSWPALAIAWAAAAGGDPAKAAVDEKSGHLVQDDCVCMSGVWVYDAAHSGWNELHPTRWVQLLPSWQCGKEIVLTYPGYPGLGPRPARGGIQGSGKPPAQESGGMAVTPHPPLKSTEEFQALVLDHWRFLLDQAEAAATKEAQDRPENRWVIAPQIG